MKKLITKTHHVFALILLTGFSFSFVACGDDDGDTDVPDDTELVVDSFSDILYRIGDVVTITGKNFGNDVADIEVTFYGNLSNEINLISDTELSAKIPEFTENGKVCVKVKDKEACSPTEIIIVL